MTVIYRGSGAWGGGQGSDLSAAQIDGNFYTLVLAIAAKAATGAGVATMTVVSNNQLQTRLTDGTFLPAITLPTATFTFRGQWLPDTVYSANDIITEGGSTYLVLLGHTSEGTFDPGANNGSGSDFYGLLLSNPSEALPAGGAEGEVLTKASATDFDVEWSPPVGLDTALSSPLDSGELLIFNGSNWVNEPQSTLSIGHSQVTGLDFSNLSDVALSSPLDVEDVPVWNGTHWTNAHHLLPAQVRQPTVTALGTTGTVSLDPTLGDVFSITPTGAVTLNAASVPAGARISIVVTTSGTSSFSITPTTNFKSTGALATGTSSGKVFTLTFVCDGVNFNETSRTVAM